MSELQGPKVTVGGGGGCPPFPQTACGLIDKDGSAQLTHSGCVKGVNLDSECYHVRLGLCKHSRCHNHDNRLEGGWMGGAK